MFTPVRIGYATKSPHQEIAILDEYGWHKCHSHFDHEAAAIRHMKESYEREPWSPAVFFVANTKTREIRMYRINRETTVEDVTNG